MFATPTNSDFEDNRLKSDFFAGDQKVSEPEPIDEITYTEPIRKQINQPPAIVDISAQVVNGAPPIPIFLKGENRLAKVLLPGDFENDDIDQIIRILTVYKRP